MNEAFIGSGDGGFLLIAACSVVCSAPIVAVG